MALVIDEGRRVIDVARSLGIGEGTLGNWVRQARVDRGERAERARTLDAAYAANPDRFRRRWSAPPKLPAVAWINDPSREALIQNK